MKQPDPKPGGQEVLPLLKKFLDERAAQGLSEYGRPLETGNGRDALQDWVDEQLDSAMYAVQFLIEWKAFVEKTAWRRERIEFLSTLLDQADKDRQKLIAAQILVGIILRSYES